MSSSLFRCGEMLSRTMTSFWFMSGPEGRFFLASLFGPWRIYDRHREDIQ